MKRILNNDSSNSSTPPSTDQAGKPVNTYNDRRPTNKKSGAQYGHKETNLSKADVEDKIQKGIYDHRIEEIGIRGRNYITRYRLDLNIKTVATEIRIYADEICTDAIPVCTNGKLTYIRNFSKENSVLYSSSDKKDLEILHSCVFCVNLQVPSHTIMRLHCIILDRDMVNVMST